MPDGMIMKEGSNCLQVLRNGEACCGKRVKFRVLYLNRRYRLRDRERIMLMKKFICFDKRVLGWTQLPYLYHYNFKGNFIGEGFYNAKGQTSERDEVVKR